MSRFSLPLNEISVVTGLDYFLIMINILESTLEEFCSSSYFLLIDPMVKEHGLGILLTFLQECSAKGATLPEKLTFPLVENVMFTTMATCNLPLQARKGIPLLISAFFKYLAESGQYPPAKAWDGWMDLLATKYVQRFRDNGSIKGETFKKNYTDVDRNDPCPCGSNKKFKKCCLKLIS